MKKNLPDLFANKINKELNNNEKVAVTKDDAKDTLETKSEKKESISYEKNINQKISSLFASPKYVYKIDAIITLKDKKVTKKIIGKNQNNLITIENELIPIGDIIDIELADK